MHVIEFVASLIEKFCFRKTVYTMGSFRYTQILNIKSLLEICVRTSVGDKKRQTKSQPSE